MARRHPSVSFLVHPGGTPAALQREIFDSLSDERQDELAGYDATRRSEALGVIMLGQLIGQTSVDTSEVASVGTSGRMHGSQRMM